MPAIEELSLSPKSRILSELLDNDNEYHIPNHQRDYKWDRENVEQYLEDVIDSQRANSQRFFGTILLSKSAHGKHRQQNRKYIVDGQQRFTTSLLTIVVMSHLARELGGSSLQLAGHIESRINPRGFEPRCRLFAPRRNYDFLKKLLTDNQMVRSSVTELYSGFTVQNKRICKTIYEAYETIYSVIVSDIAQQIYMLDDEPGSSEAPLRLQELTYAHHKVDEVQQYIRNLFDHFIYHSVFIEIEIDSWEETFQLFDGLNNRGLDLAQQDILKNVLLGRVSKTGNSSEESEALSLWREIGEALDSTSFPNFLRHMQLLTESDISLQRATNHFINKTKTDDALQTLTNLKHTAELYRLMDYPDEHPNTDVASVLKVLKTLGATRIRPIILAALLKDFKPSNMVKLLKALEILYFRRSTICQQDNKGLERNVQQIAASLFEEGEAALESAIALIQKATPSDAVFQPMFENKSGLKADVARYLLLKIENHLKFSGEPDSGLGITGGTLEHIHPRKPGDGWRGVLDASELDDVVQSIGNLTVFAKKENIKASNRSFEEKKVIYGSASESLEINKDLLTKAQWGKEEIVMRQKMLAEKALVVWPSPATNA